MKTLDEHNAERLEAIRLSNTYPKLNGIECPKCKSELMDSNNSVLCSYPPKRKVQCSKCDYTGYRY